MHGKLKGELPDTLSALIRIALKDEERVNRSRKYIMDMGGWHTPGYIDEICRVCFAGAVMSGTLNADPNNEYSPESWDAKTAAKLASLDDIRRGDVRGALIEGKFSRSYDKTRQVDDSIHGKIGNPPYYDGSDKFYARNRKNWRQWMFKCARELEARGF